MPNTIFFLSHATRNKNLADAFKNLLILGLNLRQSDIFYTSGWATGIPMGSDFNKYMQEQLKGAKMIISLITPAFYESSYCMCELGFQSQLKDVEIFPIVFPSISVSHIENIIYPIKAYSIKGEETMHALADKAKEFSPHFSISAWNEEVVNFLTKYEETKKQIAQFNLIPKTPFDEWGSVYSKVCQLVQPSSNEEGLLKQYGFTRYSIDSTRNIAFSINNEFSVQIDVCSDGKMNIQPWSKNGASLNIKEPIKGLITVMAAPPSFGAEEKPIKKGDDEWVSYKYINWYEDGPKVLLSSLEEVLKKVTNE